MSKNKKSKKAKYYAIYNGKANTVIFSDNYVSDVLPYIKGFPDVEHKSFKNEEAANTWLAERTGSVIEDKTPISEYFDLKPSQIPTKAIDISDLTPSQQEGFNLLTSGENIFLTGVAGSGKSYLINRFVKWCNINNKNILLLAPTGIAAINIGGITIHKLLRYKGDPVVSMKPKLLDLITESDIILVDEISMCRIDLFDLLCKSIERSNKRRNIQEKKNIQMIVSGDFCQLPPVISENEINILKTKYSEEIIDSGGFAFLSKYWNEYNFKVFSLKETIRQQDIAFSSVLDRIRIGVLSAIDWINLNSSKETNDGIILTPWKNRASSINERKLSELSTKEYKFTAEVYGTYKENDYPTEEVLKIKPGCRVMCLTNDSGGRYQNGSLGTVKDIYDDCIVVSFDNGNTVEISTYTWENKAYHIEEKITKDGLQKNIKSETIGTFRQIPLKLGYAITIHKSQGSTFEKAVIEPQAFTAGQLYVALSRCKTIENLYLPIPVLPQYLKINSKVLEFEKNLNTN